MLCEVSIDYLTKAVQWHVIELGISVELLLIDFESGGDITYERVISRRS